MKKTVYILLTLALALSLLAGCAAPSPAPTAAPTPTAEPSAEPTAEPTAEPVTMRIGGLTGPTSMGMAGLMEKNESGEAANDYSFTIAGTADELSPKLLQGELDMAALPLNLASVLYNNSDGAVKLLAVNTLGVLYIVDTGEEISTLADLAGKTVYATGKGSTPEYTLRYLLTQNGLDPDTDVDIQWKSEPTEAVALLAAGGGVAMLPQPYVTVAQGQVSGLRVAVDLTEQWDALNNGSTLITGALVVRSDFADAHPEQIAAFLEEYRASAEFVNANVEEAAQLIEKFGIFKAAVAAKAIPYCNITFMAGADMKEPVSGYLNVLFEQNPKSVGGAMPQDDFFYGA